VELLKRRVPMPEETVVSCGKCPKCGSVLVEPQSNKCPLGCGFDLQAVQMTGSELINFKKDRGKIFYQEASKIEKLFI
jgi:transcription initiation factor IIE alpha subunit